MSQLTHTTHATWQDFLAAPGGALTTENHASLLSSEKVLLRSLMRLAKEASETLDVRFYRIHDDATGQAFVAALVAATERGVRVRVLLDEIGGLPAGGLPEVLEAAGCRIQLFNPIEGTPLLRHTVRDHGKVVVRDARVAWVASANVGDDYAVRWHDAGVVLTGDAVAELLRDFDEIWDGASAGVVPNRSSVALPEPVSGRQRLLPIRVVANGFDGYATWPHVRAMLAAARSRIVVSHCYLTEQRVLALLCARARAGVKVIVIAPEASDVRLVDLVMHEDVRPLLAAGVRYYHYRGMSHRKAVIVDDRWLLIGSANLDALSLDMNLEVGLAIFSATFGRLATARLVVTDIRKAVRLRESPLRGWRRLFAWIAERFRDFL